MAEFKLGRIRFVWKDMWATGTTYYVDDVIRNGGKTYICAAGHTAAGDFYTDLDYSPTRWNQMTDGQSWTGDWSISKFYKENDVVKYGGVVYICNQSHTSATSTVLGLEADQSKWDTFAATIDWKGDWGTSTQYKLNDLVKYGGYTYVCNTPHTAAVSLALGLEADQSKWDIFNPGLEYKGAWSGSAVVYKVNDIVKQGAGLWISTQLHTSTASFTADAASYWSQFVEGIEFENSWSNAVTYQSGDVVRYGGNQYIAKTNHSNQTPSTSTANWDLFQEGISFSSDWSSATNYRVGNLVRLRGYSYLATADNANQEPPNTSFWQRLNSGIAWQGEWTDDVFYKLGDAVRFGSNAYICVLGHRSEGDDGSTVGPQGGGQDNSRPDQDVAGTYWNLLSIGSETSILTARGDLVYYSGSGPARLPIGIEGSVLRAGVDDPEWITLGATDQVYYVALHGTDLPAPIHGKSLDKPFKTIRYACEQVEKGPRNPNTQYLLELNRVFIQREVTSWIDYQVTTAAPASIWQNFDYDEAIFEQVTGFIIDRLQWDIGHGGNIRIRSVAQSLLGLVSEVPLTTGNDVSYVVPPAKRTQSIQAYTYMLEVIEAVIDNQAPAVVYQNVSDDSTSITQQFVDLDIISESGVLSNITVLVTSITDALANPTQIGSLPIIPTRSAPHTLIHVKTGRYRETLPIIVPAYTCILGDELRSTNTGPAGSVVDISDSYYTISSLEHIENFVGNIITGTTVAATTGNIETQSQQWPFADLEPESAATVVYTVTIAGPQAPDAGNKYVLNGVYKPELNFVVGNTYVFVQDDPTNVYFANANGTTPNPHPLNFSADNISGERGGGTSYLDNVQYFLDGQSVTQVTYYGSAFNTATSREVHITITSATPAVLYYWCWNHVAMGNIIAVSESYFKSESVAAVIELVGVMKHQADYRLGTLHLANVTDPVGYNVGYLAGHGDARKLIKENKKFLQEEAISYINATYSQLEVVGSINGTTLTVTSVVLGTVTPDAVIRGQNIVTGTTIVSQLTGTTGGTGTYTVSISQTVGSVTVKADTHFSRTALRTDIGYIVDALTYDLTYGGNSQSVAAGLAYWDGDDNLVPVLADSIKSAVLDTFAFIKTRMQSVATGANVTPLQTTVPRYLDTAGSAGASTLIGNNLDEIIDIVTNGQAAATLTDPATTNGVSSTTALISAYATLDSAAATIRANTIAYINATYPDLDYNETKCSRDVGIILKAVGFDFMLGNTASIDSFTNYQSLKAGHAYLRPTAVEVYTLGQKTITIAAIEYARTQAIANVGGNATAIARINVLMKLITDLIYGATNEGSVYATRFRNRDYAVLQLERNRQFIAAEVSAYISNTFSGTATNTTVTSNVVTINNTNWLRRGVEIKFVGVGFGGIVANTSYFVQSIVSATTFKVSTTRNGAALALTTATGTMSVALVYDQISQSRDVGTYIDALKWDLRYSANYKSRFVARYYANAVLGSQEEDMFYLRDATGLRDQTMADLNGDLLPPNEYGTSRVSAGAYASLDPGWGPDDSRTWIMTRSPYVQGLTTFGNAAIGQKIDGALHNGGNDSITSNDFTQVISDGIGAWITNNGRAELVSVFSYYAHIGYLAENGGRIRGTNGNNSYGDFGSVAEGFDDTETPNTGVVDNVFQFVATVGAVTTNGQQMLGLEFDNAGIDYTAAEFTLTGGGINASAEVDEFRDDAVFQVRLLQLAEDGVDGEFGGSGYVTNANTAQGGSTTSISLAATDSETSTAYIGMNVVVTGGAGVGQFGIINTYNSGTKLAGVVRESTGAAGFDHFVAGTTIVVPDASSTYTVEPRITFTAPVYTTAAGTGLPAAAAYSAIGYASAVQTYLAVPATGGSGTGAAFNVIKQGTKYIVTVAAGGIGYTRLNVLTIAGASLGGVTTTNNITLTVTSINSVTKAVTAVDYTGVAQGGNYVALLPGSNTAVTSIGNSWSTRTLSASANWDALASGQDLTAIAASELVSGTAYRIISLGDSLFNAVGAENNFVGVTFIATGVTSGTGTVVSVNSITVAVATGSNVTTRSVNGGITWTAGGNLPASTTWTSIAYGRGVWVAVASGGTANAYSTNGGQTWVAGGALPASTTWTSVAYGAGKFVAVASGGTSAASSTDGGVAWTARTLPSSTAWSGVAFGNNRFVAVSSTSGTAAAYSLNGIDWSASTIISAAYTAITYGQGTFLAVGASTTAASSPYGLVWTSRTISTSNSSSVAFGNVNRFGKFATISNSGATNVSFVSAGATARARASVANNKIFSVRMLEPGSGYASLPTMTITDPNNTFEAPFTVRTGDGVLANPSFVNRGIQYETASAEILRGDGFADNFQTGSFIACRRLEIRPVPGSNVVFGNLPDRTFKLVNVITFRGDKDGSYTGFLQISPQLTISETPDHLDDATLRLRYSQVRLTGHDFLDIGTGSFVESNYPNAPLQDPIPANETVDNNGGRVFFTATDQDGNFRVGDLFSIEQSTGIATLNADAFNISGLQELNLGNVTLGGGSATVTEFSTDPFFTADSDNIVPTQRAIKAFIASQIGGGGASLNVNSVTAGSIFISSNVITTVTGTPIKMDATFEFRGGVTGLPLAFNFFLN